jgi:aspartyl protease family protein
MSRLQLLILGAIGATLILLIVNDQGGMTFGLPNDDFARVAILGVWGALLAAGIMRSGMRFQDTARQAAVWIAILLGIVAAYQYRFELQDFASRVTAGLVPSRPQTAMGASGAVEVTLSKSNNGHFEADGMINGKGVSFLVDTGASSIVLSYRDALNAGIPPESLSFTSPISTANGDAFAATTRLDEIGIGGIVRRNVRAMVAEDGKLDQSLLGMTFLSSLSGYTVRQDQLILQD